MKRLCSLWLALASLSAALPADAAPTDDGTALVRALVADPFVRAKARGGLLPTYAARPSVAGGRLPPQTAAPVSIQLSSAPTSSDFAALEALGVAITRGRRGDPLLVRDRVLAHVSPAVLPKLAAWSRVREIRYDGAPFGLVRPLDVTAAEIDADDVWRTSDGNGTALSGAGVTVCDSDSGIDPFHPAFFRADGGYFAWRDDNGNGRLDTGVEGVVGIGDQPIPLLVLNGIIRSYYGEPIGGSNDPSLDVGIDWLFADVNGNGMRDLGPEAGFSDADPAFGEPLFVVDDVDGDGIVDFGEKIVRLATSKIAAIRFGGTDYRRGENLSALQRDEDVAHGTGASGVIAGGHRGFGKKVGIAPEADLIMAANSDGAELLGLTAFCIDEGARVVLHEYAPWYGYHLDGSDPLEQLIDDSSIDDDVAHINPAGNLSTSQKGYKRLLSPNESLDIAISAPADSFYARFRFLGLSLLWRDTARELAVAIEDPNGNTFQVPANSVYQHFHDGIWIYTERDDSARGTSRLDIYLFDPNQMIDLPLGDYVAHVVDPGTSTSPVELVGMVVDDTSGWGLGIHFPTDASEDHLIGWPGTADLGIAIAAYTGTGIEQGTPGERAYYSGRGFRIDGVDIMSVSAPADPVVAGYFHGEEATYFVYGGTSGASPHVAGTAALLIQHDPSLDGLGVRDRIRQSALADGNTGSVPNDDWGYGKLRAYKAVYGADPDSGNPPTISPLEQVLLVNRPDMVTPLIDDPDEPDGSNLVIELDRDYDGTFEEVLPPYGRFEVVFDTVGVYFIKMRVTDRTSRSAAALARFDVVAIPETPVEPPARADAPILSGRGGGLCFCAAPGAPSQDVPSAWLALAIASCLARRTGRSRVRSSSRASRRPPGFATS